MLVMDNLSTHNRQHYMKLLSQRKQNRIWDKFEFVYTPNHGSWLNMAEIELNVLM
jgi:DDE superfamily endonuclease